MINYDNGITSISKLIGENSEIIIVGVNIQYRVREILENSSFKDRIIHIPSTEYNSQDLLFVLRKDDLPAIEHKDLLDDEKEELKLVPINNELKIYASVIDINKEENKEIKDKWNLDNEPDNLDLKIQIALSFLSVIHWKDSREVIQINITSEFREQGIPNNINDIEPLGNDNK